MAKFKREPHLPGETVVQYEKRLKDKYFSTIGDFLLRKYVNDFINEMQKSSMMTKITACRTTDKFRISDKGAFYYD